MKRKAITERMKIDSLLWRVEMDSAQNLTLNPLRCAGCQMVLRPGQSIQWDHGVPLGLDGEHSFRNIRAMHTECHKKKTIGTKATTAGSDLHMIRKAQRIARGGKTKRGRKIPSRNLRSRQASPSVVPAKKKWPKRKRLLPVLPPVDKVPQG